MTENIDRLLPAVDDDPPEPPPSDPLLDDYETPDFVVDTAPPPPLGRSISVDLTHEQGWIFVRSGRGVIETRGLETLKTWITLCLATERGAHPALPPNFGIVGMTSGIGEHISSPAIAGREERIREALIVHPHIDDIEYHAEHDPDGVILAERVVAITDDELRVALIRRT